MKRHTGWTNWHTDAAKVLACCAALGFLGGVATAAIREALDARRNRAH